jgi:serine protease
MFLSRFHSRFLPCGAAAIAIALLATGRGVAAGDGARMPGQFSGELQQFVDRAHAYAEAARLGLNYLPGEVVVKFRPGTAPARQQRALMALDSRPGVSGLEWQGDLAVLRDPAQPDAHVLARQLASQPDVEFASPNYIGKISPFERRTLPVSRTPPRRRGWLSFVPNDEDFTALQWNMSLLRMPSAWDIQPGATADIIVAVIDTGITTAPETFTFPLWTGLTFEMVSMPVDVNPDLPADRLVSANDFSSTPTAGAVVDMDGHGSHVSSTIAETTHNSTLLAGIAWNARIMPLKACTGYWEVMVGRGLAGTPGFVPSDAGGCSFSQVTAAIRYAADNGAKVINISIGGGGQFTPLRDALAYAVSRGAFVAISMGNDFEDGNEVSYPARYAQDIEGVMSVAAVGRLEGRAFYSSTGPHCEIAAPGGDSRVGGGEHGGVIWQSTLFFPDQAPSIRRPRFDRYNAIGYQGTSMAAPHVAGLAALIMAQSPGVSPGNVEKIIRATAKDLGTPGKDDDFGNGLIQPRAALFGRGLLR